MEMPKKRIVIESAPPFLLSPLAPSAHRLAGKQWIPVLQ